MYGSVFIIPGRQGAGRNLCKIKEFEFPSCAVIAAKLSYAEVPE